MKDIVDIIGSGGNNGKKGKKNTGPVTLTKELVLSIEDAITMKIKVKDQQKTTSDHIKGLAEKMNVSTGEMNGIISNIIASREDTTKIDEKRKSIDFVEQYKIFKDENF